MDNTIITGNRLIAEFMGLQVAPTGADNKYRFYQADTSDLDGAYTEVFPKYHTSWDWLMPVVEKIADLRHKGFPINITISGGGGCYISINKSNAAGQTFDGNGIIANTLNDNYFNDYPGAKKVSSIESTWQAVIQFIQWYNTSLTNK